MIKNYDIDLLKRLNRNDFLDIIYHEFTEDNYEEVIEFKNYLMFFNKDFIKDLNIIYLIILSLTSLGKLNEAKELIHLIDNDYKEYFSTDDAKYMLLLNDDEVDKKPMLFLMFLAGCDCDSVQDIIIAYGELASNLYELGYDKSIISDINNDLMKLI